MPTSLFQYEMLPTTWFYLSSLLILASFFRFNRFFSVRNFDVVALLLPTPGLVYLAMGATFQGYAWLWVVGALLFVRLALDVFLRRRPILQPNLNFVGLAFSCVAASAFIIPNLFLNRGDARESPRAWRLEQILTAAEESEGNFELKNWPGYRPFLLATQRTNKFFAPSQEAWRAAVAERQASRDDGEVAEFFGAPIRLDEKTSKRRRAVRAVQWAAGMTDGPVFDFEAPSSERASGDSPLRPPREPEEINGLQAATSVPVAPTAPRADGSDPPRELPSVEAAGLSGSVEPSASFRANPREESRDRARDPVSPTLDEVALILCAAALQLGVALTIVLIGKQHFGSLQTGLACGLFYLLLPYINQFSARLDHAAPALAILLATLFYRRPVAAGLALGVAGSLVFYPFFLVPLWLGFYWKKGAFRFATGLSIAVLTLAVAMLFFENSEIGLYGKALGSMFGRHSIFLAEADGLWEFMPRFYRVPLIALYAVYCLGFALWVPHKNLGTLVSCSAALMLGVQFWMGRQGGLYMAWYLPLVVLTVFRPNLEDRVASNVVVDI